MMDILTSLKNQCARREYCSSDIISKLGRKGVTGEDASRMLEELKSGGWVNDARYAGCYVREKSSMSGWGPGKIRYMLSLKGMPQDVVEAAMSEMDTDRASKRKADILETKWREICRREEDGNRRRMKLWRYAAGRGYTPADAENVISHIQKPLNSYDYFGTSQGSATAYRDVGEVSLTSLPEEKR